MYILMNCVNCFKSCLFLGTCGILVPRPGMEPAPLAVEARSFNHWAAREILSQRVFHNLVTHLPCVPALTDCCIPRDGTVDFG